MSSSFSFQTRLLTFLTPSPHSPSPSSLFLYASLLDTASLRNTSCLHSMHLHTFFLTPCHALTTSSPNQVAAISRKEMTEAQHGNRDRGRMRKFDRAPARPRSSRSKSPRDKSPYRFRRPTNELETPALSACPVCLSRQRHPIKKCQAPNLWNGLSKARCSRTDEGRLVDGKNRPLCLNWNQSIGCNDKSTRHNHECSGCGDTAHGAQSCPLAEKAQPADTPQRR